MTITYNSPRVKGREGHIFTKDGLIKTATTRSTRSGAAGANAATTLKTDGDLMIGDLAVPTGTYTLFVDISDPDNWTLIVNKKTGEWGLAYDGSQDLGRVKMKMSKPPSMVEDLKYDHQRRQTARSRWRGRIMSRRFPSRCTRALRGTRTRGAAQRRRRIAALPVQ